ncbi:hypothetical protein B9Z19DRAFT_181580 [Tuber borchii]|uniref:Uncharacterized protein n=1 Tax=Tuber borchii TaxID=42251 RepID=A0A2T6ZP13_TUBBO|nr:hypothetical protein B9Z19DRAFT_181580 [Tuber borchii]
MVIGGRIRMTLLYFPYIILLPSSLVWKARSELGCVLFTSVTIQCRIFHFVRLPYRGLYCMNLLTRGRTFPGHRRHRLWKHPPSPRAHGTRSRSRNSRLDLVSPMWATSPSPPPLPPPHYHSEAHTTSTPFSVISTPLDQSPRTNPLIYAAEKAGSSTLLRTLRPIFRGHQPLLSGNVANVIHCKRRFCGDVVLGL